MAYTPIDNGSFVPGTLGTASAWDSLITNDCELYSSKPATYAVASGAFVVSGASETVVAYFGLPANYDQQPILVMFGYSQDGTTATVKLQVTDGSAADSGTTTVTSSSGEGQVTVTPSATSGSGTPRYGILSLTATSGKYIALGTFTVLLYPGTARAGESPSRYAPVSSTWAATEAPIPSAVVQRLRNNPFFVAKDRPSAIYSWLDQSQDARSGLIATTQTTFQFVVRPFLPICPHIEKTYRIWAYVERFNTAKASVQVAIGNNLIELTDNHGIMTTTFTSTGGNMNASPGLNEIRLKLSSGSGSVALRTLQILEEPS